MATTPRYSTHLYYGREFLKYLKLFRELIKKDSRFLELKQYEDQGLFSLAVREMIKDYVKMKLKKED